MIPPPRPSHYVYAVVDVTDIDRKPLKVELSRGEAQKWRQFRPDADNLRVRRARLTLFHS